MHSASFNAFSTHASPSSNSGIASRGTRRGNKRGDEEEEEEQEEEEQEEMWGKTTREVTGVDLDLCVDNLLAVRNTQLLRTYAALDPRVTPFVFAIKRWAKTRGVSDASQGTFSSYGHVMLAIHYLQVRGIIPSLQSDASLAQSSYAVVRRLEGVPTCDTSFCVDPAKAMAMHYSVEDSVSEVDAEVDAEVEKDSSSLGDLLHGYFHYLADTFCVAEQTTVVSIRLGRLVNNRGDAREVGALMRDKGGRRKLPPPWRMAIEDPFERAHDLADPIRQQNVKQVCA